MPRRPRIHLNNVPLHIVQRGQRGFFGHGFSSRPLNPTAGFPYRSMAFYMAKC